MGFSINTTVSDGVTKQYPVTFTNGIYDRDHVFVYVQGDVDGTGEQLERAFTWINDGLIELDVAAPAGKTVTIQRKMNRNTPDVDYADGAILNETNLDQGYDHLLNLIHEIFDGEGVTNPISTTDLITHNTGTAIVNLETYLRGLIIGEGAIDHVNSFSAAVLSNSPVTVRTTSGYYSDTIGSGASTYFKTASTGTPGTTDGGSYFIGVDGFRWELVHDGTVYIEQFGVREGTAAGEAVRTACNVASVKEVKTNLATAIFDRIVYIDRNDLLVDLTGCTVSWVGDYDVYAEFGGLDLDNSRNIGIFHAAGSLTGTEETTSTSIEDGTRTLDVTSGSAYTEGQFVCLKIDYPRRASFVRVVARIVEITGNALTLDYTFGWSATSCTIQPVDVRKNITVKGFNYVDNSGAIDGVLENKVAGVGYRYAYNCHAINTTGENYSYPLNILKFAHTCHQIDGKGIRPRFTTSGQGYTAQVNEGIFCHTIRPVGEQVRHVIDYTGGGYNKTIEGRAIREVISTQYSFHGMYEHDIELVDCTMVAGDNSITIADSGANFGEAAKRIVINGGRFSGRIKSQNATDFTIKGGAEFLYGNYATNEIELGCNGTLRIEDVKFPYDTLVRARPRGNNPEPIGDIYISRSVLPEEFRFTFHTGRVFIDESEVTGLAVSSAPHSESLKVTGGKVNLEGSWRVTCTEAITFDGVDVIQASGTSNSRIVCEAPAVAVTDCTFYNGAGAFGSGSVVDSFIMSGVKSASPDASTTSSQFALDDTTNARMIVTGCALMADAAAVGNSYTIDPVGPGTTNTNAALTLSDSYIEGNVRIVDSAVPDIKISDTKFKDEALANLYVKNIAGTTYTLGTGDEGNLLVFTNTAAANITIPGGLPVGFEFRFCKPTTTGNLNSTKPPGEGERGGTISITATSNSADFQIKRATKITSNLWQVEENV